MSKLTKAIVIILVAAFTALVYWAVKTVPEVPEDTGPTQHIMTYDGNKITEMKDGKVIWEMTADSIEVVAETKTATMQNVKCKYNTEDDKVVYLFGDKAIYNQATDDVDLLDNIRMRSSDGYVMNCKKVTWFAKDQKLLLDGDVKMNNSMESIQATGEQLEATESFNVFKLKGKAHMGKDLPDIEIVTLEVPEADKAEFEKKENEAKAKSAQNTAAPAPATAKQ